MRAESTSVFVHPYIPLPSEVRRDSGHLGEGTLNGLMNKRDNVAKLQGGRDPVC